MDKTNVNSVDLEDLGILKATKVPKQWNWLSDEDKHLLVTLLFHGEDGMHKRDVKKLAGLLGEAVLKLEANGLTVWEYDNRGTPMYYCLTWKGSEVAETLKRVAQHDKPSKN